MTTSPTEGRWIPEFDFGDKVRKIRRAKGLTQGEFAKQLGVTASAASAWESAGDRTPRDVVTIAKRIELAFGVPAAWLLGLDVEIPGPDGGPGGQQSGHTVVTRLGAGRLSRAEDSFGGGADRTNREAA